MNVAPRYAFVCALALAGCNLFPGAGSRAADFIESLVEAEAPPADVSGGLAARVALDY